LTIFLEVDAATAAERRSARGGEAELFENPQRQRKVIEQYLTAIGSRGGKDRIARLDGNRPIAEVSAQVLDLVRRALKAAGASRR
jgi:thymidylate kinase